MEDNDKKSELPIHLIFGASEYSRIKTETKGRIGKPPEPIVKAHRARVGDDVLR